MHGPRRADAHGGSRPAGHARRGRPGRDGRRAGRHVPRVGPRQVRPVTAEPDQLAALRRGDEQAFRDLVGAHQSSLLRLAMSYAPSRAVAEEIVQETWLAVLDGLDGFEGRASLRTWVARILVNIAQRRSGREARSAPFSSLVRDDGDAAEPAVDPSRFLADGPYAGHWASFPDDWSGVPERALLSQDVRALTTA